MYVGEVIMIIADSLMKEEKREKVVEANDVTIYKYLESSKKIVVPRYQREYSWNYKNINMLIKDLKKDYYIGNIIEYNDVEFMRKEIVDGQQRTITIFLILIVLRNLIEQQEIKNEIYKLITDSGKSKLILKYRISSSGSDILEYFINDAELPNDVNKKYNEIQMYKMIKKQLKQQSQEELKNLYFRLKNSILIEISFYKNEMEAHEMFVNVNTKGRPLEKIEIIKSQLFKYLLNAGESDEYKEKWHNMLEKIPKNDYNTFCSDVYLFDLFDQEGDVEKYKTSGTVDENCMKLIDSINSIDRAKRIFKFMASEESNDLLPVYSAIKNYKIVELKDNYYKNLNVSIGKLDLIWKLYKEIRFKQSDIMFISLLLDKEHYINSEINYMCTFVQYMFIYELCRSFMNISPANYSNRFKQAAARLYNCKDNNKIKDIIKEFVKDLTIESLKAKESLLAGSVSTSKSKTLKLIIMMAEENYVSGLHLEHFIPQRTDIEEDKEYIWKIGNLIPVVNDKYSNKPVDLKLNMYNEDREADVGIKNFLQYDINKENYKLKIQKRSEVIVDKFIEKMNNCYNTIMEG